MDRASSGRTARLAGMDANESSSDGFDPATYGRSFADVYDAWYPGDATTTATVSFVSRLARSTGTERPRALELGAGTGRLALPLAHAGIEVVGLDSSPEMLELLREKDVDGSVTPVLGDVGDPTGWPDGPFDVVLAACNLICNVTDPSIQSACITGAAAHLRPGGYLVVEAFEPAPLEAGRRLGVGEVRNDVLVLIASDTDVSTGVVVGQHVELRDGEPVRLRPWRIRVTTPAELDGWATAAGLVLVERSHRWGDVESDGLVSVYRRRT